MSKYCIKCGKELNDTAKFCSDCGHPVEEEAKTEETKDVDQELSEQIKKNKVNFDTDSEWASGTLTFINIMVFLFCFVGMAFGNIINGKTEFFSHLFYSIHPDYIPEETTIWLIIFIFLAIGAIYFTTIFLLQKAIRAKGTLLVLGGIVLLSSTIFGGHKYIEATSLPKCDSEWAMNQAQEIVEYHNGYLNKLKSVGFNYALTPRTAEPISYDKDIKKYECRMKLEVRGASNEPIPQRINTYTGIGSGFYEYAEANVTYSIFKEQGKNTVLASTGSSWGEFWDFKNFLYRGW